jgi:hypothetical protein
MSGKPTPAPAAPKPGREWMIGLAGGIVALAGLGYALSTMGAKVRGDWMTGVIEEKQFTPGVPETQISVGKDGLSSRQVEGEYTFVVRGESDGKIYTVWVGKADYEAKSPGERFRFLRPKGTGADTR